MPARPAPRRAPEPVTPTLPPPAAAPAAVALAEAAALPDPRREFWIEAVTIASAAVIAVCIVAQVVPWQPTDAALLLFAAALVGGTAMFGWRHLAALRLETTRLRAELQAARESERWHQAVLNDVTEAVLVASPEGRLLETNQAAWSLLGRGRDELAGRRLWDLLPLDERLVALRRGEIVTTHGGGLRRLLRPDGSAVLADVSWSTLEDGRVIYLARPFR